MKIRQFAGKKVKKGNNKTITNVISPKDVPQFKKKNKSIKNEKTRRSGASSFITINFTGLFFTFLLKFITVRFHFINHCYKLINLHFQVVCFCF